MSAPLRYYRVRVRLGTGATAGIFETTVLAPSLGPFRQGIIEEHNEMLRGLVAARFPNETVTLVGVSERSRPGRY